MACDAPHPSSERQPRSVFQGVWILMLPWFFLKHRLIFSFLRLACSCSAKGWNCALLAIFHISTTMYTWFVCSWSWCWYRYDSSWFIRLSCVMIIFFFFLPCSNSDEGKQLKTNPYVSYNILRFGVYPGVITSFVSMYVCDDISSFCISIFTLH